jgi:(p)ppGpp synthase/HD superfamily hydrolase
MGVEAAERFAVRAHRGHVDAYGRPFIDHPRRVAAHTSLQHDEVLVAAALLHDAVEKGGATWAEVRDAGADDELLTILDSLTQRVGELTGDYLARVALEPRAVLVKRVDLLDKLSARYTSGLATRDRNAVRIEAARRLALLDRLTTPR